MNGQAFSKWNKAIQLRVSEATAAIAQMKGIRIMGLDQAVGGHLHSLRANEVRESRTARLLRILFVDMCRFRVVPVTKHISNIDRYTPNVEFVRHPVSWWFVLDRLEGWS